MKNKTFKSKKIIGITLIFGIMILFNLIFISATVTFNLNPPNNSVNISDMKLYCSANSDYYILNMSLFTNITGDFGVKETRNLSINETTTNVIGLNIPKNTATYLYNTIYINNYILDYYQYSIGYECSIISTVEYVLVNGTKYNSSNTSWEGEGVRIKTFTNPTLSTNQPFGKNISHINLYAFSQINCRGYIYNNTWVTPATNSTSFDNTFILNINKNNIIWGCEVCDNNDGEGINCYNSNNYTLNIGSIINSIDYEPIVYETQTTSYLINISSDESLTNVKLYINGKPYTTIKNGNIWSHTFGSIPSSYIGNNSIVFSLNYNGVEYNTTTQYQTVNPILFGLCNATLTVPYLNISFKDESTLNKINGTIQSSTFVYYLGDGTVNKTYTYTTSNNYSNYLFCSLPSNLTYNVKPEINYLLTGYPNRIYQPTTLTLTNSTTNKTLYLLSSADGIYVTFITSSTFNTPINNVDITITRILDGTETIIFSGLTDSAGSVTVWLNPNYDHKITASKTGYTTNIQTVKPALYQYTLTMETALDSYEYVSDRKGLKWFAFPASGVIKSTNYTSFGYNISAKNNNIVSCKLELLNSNKTTLITSAETFTTNGTLCSVSIDYSMNYSIVKGRLLVNLGDGYQILEDDAFWRLVQYNTTGSTLIDWFKGLSQLELSYFNNDEQHREYTYILLFFLVVMIICAVLNRMGWDIQTNGGMIFLVGILVWGASVPGFLTLNDLTPFVLVNKFFVAIVYSMFMIGFAMRELT